MATTRRRLAFTLPSIVASFALATPACAQFARGPAAFDQVRAVERAQFRDFWDDRGWSHRNNSPGSFWGDRRPSYPNRSYDPYTPYRRQQVYESIKPPTPRKTETPPAETVVVIGDSFAEWLAYGLEEVFAETPQIGIVRKIKQDLGLVRDDPRLDAPEWTQAIKDLLPATEKPNAIVVMLGVNDRAPLRERPPPAKEAASSSDNAHPGPAPAGAPRQPPSASYEFHTDKWAELYSKRIDDMIAALKTRGVPIIWVGLPAIRGTKSTTDMSYLDELYRARADKAGIAYVDIWDGFVDDQGRYVQDGPDFEGQTRRLRTYDGVYFTKAGAEKLGHYVEHDLRRVLSSPVMPVALPGPEEQSPAKDAVGPVLPLNAIGTEKSGELLGAAKPAGRTGSRSARHARAQSRRSDCCTARSRRRILLAACRHQRRCCGHGTGSRCRPAQGFSWHERVRRRTWKCGEEARGGRVWRGQKPSEPISAYAECDGRQTAP